MTTVLSQKGQLVLPVPVREQLHLAPGDDFEVAIEDEDTITLRRISTPANHGLVDLLLARPAPFEIPPREHEADLYVSSNVTDFKRTGVRVLNPFTE